MPKGVYIRTKYCIKNEPIDIWKRINRVGDDECWEWMGLKDKDGYGRIKINHKTVRCHRLVYELTFGQIINDSLVCHKCNNPSCCNPKHLFLGTPKENIKQRDEENRANTSKGENHYRTTLTEKIVLEIRKKYLMGIYTQKELAKEYNTTIKTIESIILRHSWKHI